MDALSALKHSVMALKENQSTFNPNCWPGLILCSSTTELLVAGTLLTGQKVAKQLNKNRQRQANIRKYTHAHALYTA